MIIFGVLFTAGNIVWPFFNEPKLFYVPLAIFISIMLRYILSTLAERSYPVRMLVLYLFILSCSNVVKQVLYTDKIKQINDYFFGAVATLWLLIMIIRWAILRQHSGKK